MQIPVILFVKTITQIKYHNSVTLSISVEFAQKPQWVIDFCVFSVYNVLHRYVIVYR